MLISKIKSDLKRMLSEVAMHILYILYIRIIDVIFNFCSFVLEFLTEEV